MWKKIVRVRKAPTEAYKCDACEKIFTQKRYLSQHKRTHAVRMPLGKYDCKFCEKIFTSNQNLGKHIQKKHPNPRRVENANVGVLVLDSSPPKVRQKNKKIFNCKQCKYESGRRENLKRHLETHSANRVRTGRPKKPPGERSSVTKRLYAKRSHNEFMEKMRKNNLEEEIMKLMEKDARKKDPKVSKVTEKEIINMIGDFDLSDIKMLRILRRLRKLFGRKAFTPIKTYYFTRYFVHPLGRCVPCKPRDGVVLNLYLRVIR